MLSSWKSHAAAVVVLAEVVAAQAGWVAESYSVPPDLGPVMVTAYCPARQSLLAAHIYDNGCNLSEYRTGLWTTSIGHATGASNGLNCENGTSNSVAGYWDATRGEFVILASAPGVMGALLRWLPGSGPRIVANSIFLNPGETIAAAFYDAPTDRGMFLLSSGAVMELDSSGQTARVSPPVTPYIDYAINVYHGLVLRSSTLDTTRRRVVALVGFPQPMLWEYDLARSTWIQSRAMPAGFQPRMGAALGYDPIRQVTVIFGGHVLNSGGQFAIGSPLADAWHYDGTQVYQAAVGSTPAGRWGGMFVWNSTAQLLTLVGGANMIHWCNNLRDVWTYLPGQRGVDFTTYGSGCAGTRGVPFLEALPNALPFAGQPFSLLVKNVPLFAPVFMMIGASDQTWSGQPLPFSLAPFGAPGCSILTGPDLVYPTTNVLGTALWNVTLPGSIGGATLFQQAVVFDAAANSAGLTLSDGGRSLVGF